MISKVIMQVINRVYGGVILTSKYRSLTQSWESLKIGKDLHSGAEAKGVSGARTDNLQ
jgi:hypothetical protein